MMPNINLKDRELLKKKTEMIKTLMSGDFIGNSFTQGQEIRINIEDILSELTGGGVQVRGIMSERVLGQGIYKGRQVLVIKVTGEVRTKDQKPIVGSSRSYVDLFGTGYVDVLSGVTVYNILEYTKFMENGLIQDAAESFVLDL